VLDYYIFIYILYTYIAIRHCIAVVNRECINGNIL